MNIQFAGVEDSNKTYQNTDFTKSKILSDHKEKCDEPKSFSPAENKVLNDTLQKKLAGTTFVIYLKVLFC